MIERIETTIPGDAEHRDPALPAFAMLAPGATRGVVVVHEIFGRQPEIDRVVERFAAAGYAAVAPELFAHGRFACLRQTLRTMGTGEVTPPIRQARQARRWLMEKSGVAEDKVGIIGFCFGGMFALAVGKGWAVHSANYGRTPEARAMEGIGPVIACYGSRDGSMRGQPALVRERLAKVGATHEVHEFPTVGHAFLTDGSHPVMQAIFGRYLQVGYDPAVAEDAWKKIFAFFDHHLG